MRLYECQLEEATAWPLGRGRAGGEKMLAHKAGARGAKGREGARRGEASPPEPMGMRPELLGEL